MDAIRDYLGKLPYYPELIMGKIGEMLERNELDYNNAEEMRLGISKAQVSALDDLKSGPSAYYIVTYPQVIFRCKECGPPAEAKGAYWEISNPISCARGLFPHRMIHELVVHGNAIYHEPIVNMSETEMGTFSPDFYWKRLQKILAGLPLPPQAAAELQAMAANSAR